jgi:methyl-accepting chemotaxis protein
MSLSLNDLKLRHKLWLNQAIMSLSVFVLAGAALFFFRENLLDDRRAKTVHLVDTAHTLVSHYADLAAEGRLPEAEARVAALEVLRALRYGADGYFWVNDFGPSVVMHPFKTALEGKDVSDVEDPSGKPLFLEFVKVARESGQGFVDYQWPKGDGKEPLPKISFVKAFEPWGWIIGTGIYVDDVDRVFYQWAGVALAVLLVGTVIQLILAAVIGRSVTRPIDDLMRAMDRVRTEGELSLRCSIRRRDEIGAMSRSFNYMMDGLQASVSESSAVAQRLATASEQLTRVAEESKRILDEKSLRTTQVASAMNEMSATVRDVAQNASSAAEAARSADQEGRSGRDVVRGSVRGIDDLAAKIQRAADVVASLQGDVGSIEKVTDVIEGIAEQTNLLALNAAIEAARAGDTGRGFAVVADEVRSLAQRTQASTAEIQQMIDGLQSGAKNAVAVMNDSQAQAQDSVAQAQAAGTSFETIAQAIDRINEMTTQIATASEEQSTVAEEINRNVQDIEDLSQRSLDGAAQTSEASDELRATAHQLLDAVARFKV